MNLHIPGIDIDKAVQNSGSMELFLELLNDVYKIIAEKSDLVETYVKEKDLTNYTILVHSLKTTCRMIGAMDLGEEFFTLEKLGKENHLEQIEALTPEVLSSFRSLKSALEPYASQANEPTRDFDKSTISTLLNKLIHAIDDFDLGTSEETANQLLTYQCDEELSSKLSSLAKLVSNLDYEEAKEHARDILDSL